MVRRLSPPPGRRVRTRGLALGLVLALASLPCAVSASEAVVAQEYQIKAAFLFSFTKFVEWPAARFAGTESPIVIGLVGRDPFGPELALAVRDRRVNGRPVTVVVVETPAEAAAVHVLFVSDGAEKRLASLGKRLPGVLTVGESEQFTRAEGIITFTIVDNKVRFEINVAAADRAHLRISAQLQKLAVAVRRKP